MDFRRAAERYAALGSPAQLAERIRAFHAAGVRHLVLDLVGPYEERDRQIAAVARDVLPLLADLVRLARRFSLPALQRGEGGHPLATVVTAAGDEVRPPSTTYWAPVTLPARSEHRNSTTLATSSGVP